jgi:hypothetical protein
MKKYTHSVKYKNYMRKRAFRSLNRQVAFKNYKRLQRQSEQGIPQFRLKQLNATKHNKFRHKHVYAPDNFSFVDNPDGMCSFISSLAIHFDNKSPVYVDLADIDRIDYGAIAVLLSVMVRFKAMLIPFNGSFPNNINARKTLVESKFFEHLGRSFKDSDSYELGASTILTHAMKSVDSLLSEKIIKSASTTVWGTPRRCRGIYRTLIELMQNTNNHASPDTEGDKHWWLSVKHFRSEKRVAFSFVDYGVGVFNSLEHKRAGSKFFDVLPKILRLFKPKNKPDILKLIFQGELHKIASGKYYRGKGLPGIYNAYHNGNFGDFVMITNDVMYDSRTEEYRNLEIPFSGTFVYWVLDCTNRSLLTCV